MEQTTFERIRAYLLAQKEELTEQLCALVRVPSVRGEAKPHAPFGEDCARALCAVRDMYTKNGFSSALYAEEGYLLTEAGNPSSGKTIGLFAHADVVPAGENWTVCAPFEPVARDGWVFGRGSGDNKSGILLSLCAAKAVRDLDLPLRSRLLLYTGSNEESGMADIRKFAEQQPMPEISLVPDNGYPVYRGEKGILRFWAEAGETVSDILSFDGGEAFNVVLGSFSVTLRDSDKLFAALSEKVKTEENMTLTRESGVLRLSVEGISAHASSPNGAVHGVFRVASVLAACEALPAGDRALMRDAAALTGDCFGESFGIASKDPDFGVLTCANGIAALRDGRPALTFDIRYGTMWDSDTLENTIREKLALLGWSMVLESDRPGFALPDDDPRIRTILDTYNKCTGASEEHARLSGGGTYARFLKPGFSFGHSVWRQLPVSLPAGHGGAHQPDEFASIDGLIEAAAIDLCIILALDEQLHME